MYFEQFYLTCLAHASYMIASDGIAAVVDPQRDVGLYLREAEEHGFRIQHVIETHLHADFVSGHQELAAATGAKIYLGEKAGATFPHVPVKDGDEVEFGRCRLRFLSTPGHTLESICIVVTDFEKSPEPCAVLSGDTLFIGDVGRPDLSGDLTPKQLAAMLYDSLHNKLLTLPDDVAVYPAHGAGSLCGRQMSAERSSTIGREKLGNYALRARDKQEFIEMVTAELPERPGYFAQDVEMNRSGAAPLTALAPLPAIEANDLLARQAAGAVVLDTRPAGQFAAGHVPGSIQIGLSGQYASWAGILLGLDHDILIVAEDQEHAQESRVRLARVGIERVGGYLRDGLAAWVASGHAVEQVPQVPVDQLNQSLLDDPGGIQVVDVRRPAEFTAGHVPAAVLKPLDKLASLTADLDWSRPVAVYCQGGYRSAIASSVLKRAGVPQVINVIGGFDAWKKCGLPVAAE
jgi:hydroxyacylglutathione hydrolase